jgi:alginate O-acetyltransferase complex protein AlgI
VCVTAAMVVFRAPTVRTAGDLLKGMVGLNGVALPGAVYDRLGFLAGWLQRAGVTDRLEADIRLVAWVLALGAIALLLPNTLQLLKAHEPALGVRPDQAERGRLERAWAWSPSLSWAIGASVMAAIGVLHLGGKSEFLYWQF